ncbi:MAG: hypothetical protein ACAI44_24005 [Candidatus Sericytochromatia bacterium]
MPAIQAMRSDALAMRAKEDVQEKIPSFFNSVTQALGQSVMSGQDAAEQLIESRFQAANQLSAQLRNKVDGQGALAEMTTGAGMKLISSFLSVILMALQKTTTTDAIQVASDIANFLLERKTLQLQWDAVAATYAEWTVQAGYSGHDGGTNPDYFFPGATSSTPTSVTQTFVVQQWLDLGVIAGAPPTAEPPASPPAGSPTDGSFLGGRNYTGLLQTPAQQATLAATLKPYLYRQQINNGQTPPVYQGTGLSVIMDATDGSANDDNNPGTGDFPAPVYYDSTTNHFYIAFQFEYTDTGAPGATSDPPTVSGTVNNVNNYGTTGTAGQSGYYPGYTIEFSDPNVSALGANSANPQTFTAPQPSILTRAMGGRGAIKYRDALTPRFTDRTSYAGSDLGAGAYETYYAWGSVGSITRVGQY